MEITLHENQKIKYKRIIKLRLESVVNFWLISLNKLNTASLSIKSGKFNYFEDC